MEKLIAQGAEAKIFKENNSIVKDRISKGYRLPELDEKIRKQRTAKESRILEKASKITNVPKILQTNKFSLELEYIEGDKLADKLNSYPEKKQFEVMKLLGKEIGKLHNADIIHGDLTTSNTILVKEKSLKKTAEQGGHQIINANAHGRGTGEPRAGGKNFRSSANFVSSFCLGEEQKFLWGETKVFIIDFGLSFISKRLEDKAVDLHLIQQALEAKHYQNHKKLYKSFLQGYKPKDKKKVLEQLKKVELRGRYKH